MSSQSNISKASDDSSRPPSNVFPMFNSSLPYALVRDFAYPDIHPLHYGPPPTIKSGDTTPASEPKRFSDPIPPYDGSRASWSIAPWEGESSDGAQLPAMTFSDGPPYSEDEDLQSPVVTSSRHRKHKSSHALGKHRGRSPGPATHRGPAELLSPNFDGGRGLYAGTNHDGSETYYMGNGDEDADGPGGELVTYPAEQARHSIYSQSNPETQDPSYYNSNTYQDYRQPGEENSSSSSDISDASDPNNASPEESRYSRNYQFTIASPDEEMHGKAVALFDFARENENELPLVEGQVIWVSYRHGQGWLVAEDPKTGENGLVPEEYVRLLRYIEGGYASLNGDNDITANLLSPTSLGPDSASAATPTQSEHSKQNSQASTQSSTGGSTHNGSSGSGEKHPPIVSTFSTSSKDLDPYPQHLLGMQAGMTPPQVARKGSEAGAILPTLKLGDPPADAKRPKSGDEGAQEEAVEV
ncbi:MAG: HOG (high osmolarity glycerol) pathway protein [Cirrosporium novae-zelandiae]|nr:MAG: HOG (high osmolarity glycerol) pathway protein [Cirrosporium novae-zelandiae]